MRLIYLCLTFIILTGCTSKSPIYPDQNLVQSEQSIEDDEMFDDFEDETQVEYITDPFSGYNRAITLFNDKLSIYVLTPVSKSYAYIFHKEIRSSVSKFYKNLYYPTRVVNNTLQGKFLNTLEETQRFILNSTVGVLGLFDPAKYYFDIEEHNEDFGQTLGYYGVGSGPHIVLPLFGPSNLRDLTGMFPDSYLSPIDYDERAWFTLTDTPVLYLSARAYEEVNNFSLNIEQYEKIRKDAIDLYPYLRDVYEQYRDNQIKE